MVPSLQSNQRVGILIMPRQSTRRNDAIVTLAVPAELKGSFESAAAAVDRSADEVLRDFMRTFVRERAAAAAEHDAWFRAQVQAALDDPSPSIPHEEVVKATRALLDRLAAEAAGRAD